MDKLTKLKNYLSQYKSCVVAFSGGVDSSFLAAVTNDVFKDRCLLITATSASIPFYELEEAKDIAQLLGLEHRTIISEEIKIPGFVNNPPDRCYYCKTELFTLVQHIAKKEGYDVVFDGSNADDKNDYRPGQKAKKEQGIISPLMECDFTKEDIRKYSRQYKLPTANKPAYACLASRFPYGEKITTEKLNRLAKTELKIRELGFTQFRVRSHDDLARLEIIPEEMEKAWQIKNKLFFICKSEGFTYISIDLQGYRTGAMNEVLTTTA